MNACAKYVNYIIICFCFFTLVIWTLDSLDFDNWAIVNKSKISSSKKERREKNLNDFLLGKQ